MFFILNNEKAVLAADKAFLESVGAHSIYTLAELFRSGDVQLDEENNTYQIEEQTQSFVRSALQTTVGNAYLYHVEEDVVAPGLPIPSSHDLSTDTQEEDTAAHEVPEEDPVDASQDEKVEETNTLELPTLEEEAPLLILPDEAPADAEAPALDAEEEDLLELLDLSDEDDLDTPQQEEKAPETLSNTDEEDLLDLIDFGEDETEKSDALDAELPLAGAALVGAGAALLTEDATPDADEKDAPSLTSDDVFDLMDSDKEPQSEAANEETAVEASLDALLSSEDASLDSSDATSETYTFSTETPFADYHNNADIIGITYNEYTGFLRQFTEESLENEDQLRDKDLFVSRQSITSLKDASQLLHLPKITEKLSGLEEAASGERDALVNHFFGMIEHMRHDIDAVGDDQPTQTPPLSTPTIVESEEPDTIAPSAQPSTPSIDVSTDQEEAIEPIPFDFSTKVASDELGLPEALVQEFVSDFIKQADENISVFQEAQRNGDIDTIQKTAHLLKGAASNLRIDPLAETLETLQYNEDIEKVPDLFRLFRGQLKALTHFTDQSGS